jgi:hypothetical protein
MRRFRAPSSGLDKFFAAQFSAGYITNMSGFDLRQGQLQFGEILITVRGLQKFCCLRPALPMPPR